MGAGAEPAFFLPDERNNPTMRKDVRQLWDLAEPHVVGAGLELVELESGRDPSGWVVRLYIDRPQGVEPARAPVSFEDCERVSRDVSAALDVADLIPHAYRLEVSSPGIDRPLRRVRDFQRFAGEKVKVRTIDAVSGRRNFSGTIRGVQGDLVEVDCDGQTYQVPVGAIARAHLVPDWDAEFRKARSQGDSPGDHRSELHE
jgi:ribosome maturation factor RimP